MSSLFSSIDPKAAAGDLSIVRASTRLKLAVMASGLKQAEIAVKMQVRPSVVSRWLSGKQNIGTRALAELAWALGFELDMDFIDGEGRRVTDLRSCGRLEYFVHFTTSVVDTKKKFVVDASVVEQKKSPAIAAKNITMIDVPLAVSASVKSHV